MLNESERYQDAANGLLVVFLFRMVSNSSWLSANKICSSSHSQNTTIPDCFYSYEDCKIYLVILTFANGNVLRKFFNHSSCSSIILGLFFFVLNSFERLLDTFCCLKLGFRSRAIKIAYCPWAIRENPASSAANQIARFIKTNACHIIIKYTVSFSF